MLIYQILASTINVPTTTKSNLMPLARLETRKKVVQN